MVCLGQSKSQGESKSHVFITTIVRDYNFILYLGLLRDFASRLKHTVNGPLYIEFLQRMHEKFSAFE